MDRRTRECEREWRSTGTDDARVAYLRQLNRSGQLPTPLLTLAAYCGDPVARAAADDRLQCVLCFTKIETTTHYARQGREPPLDLLDYHGDPVRPDDKLADCKDCQGRMWVYRGEGKRWEPRNWLLGLEDFWVDVGPVQRYVHMCAALYLAAMALPFRLAIFSCCGGRSGRNCRSLCRRYWRVIEVAETWLGAPTEHNRQAWIDAWTAVNHCDVLPPAPQSAPPIDQWAWPNYALRAADSFCLPDEQERLWQTLKTEIAEWALAEALGSGQAPIFSGKFGA